MACHFPWQGRDRSGVRRNDLANDTQGCRGPSQVAPFRNQRRKLTCSQISMRASRGVCRLHAVYLSEAKNLSIRNCRETPLLNSTHFVPRFAFSLPCPVICQHVWGGFLLAEVHSTHINQMNSLFPPCALHFELLNLLSDSFCIV